MCPAVCSSINNIVQNYRQAEDANDTESLHGGLLGWGQLERCQGKRKGRRWGKISVDLSHGMTTQWGLAPR